MVADVPANYSAVDTTNAAGVGTYVLGQAASGLGIRDYRYDFDIGSPSLETFLNYGNGGGGRSTEVHAVGTRWASTLWDINHLLIQKYGFDADLLSGYSAGGAGNKLALQLIMDALKLQPANPSFIGARNAILQADQVLTGGVNQREIWTAFARRRTGLRRCGFQF